MGSQFTWNNWVDESFCKILCLEALVPVKLLTKDMRNQTSCNRNAICLTLHYGKQGYVGRFQLYFGSTCIPCHINGLFSSCLYFHIPNIFSKGFWFWKWHWISARHSSALKKAYSSRMPASFVRLWACEEANGNGVRDGKRKAGHLSEQRMRRSTLVS